MAAKVQSFAQGQLKNQLKAFDGTSGVEHIRFGQINGHLKHKGPDHSDYNEVFWPLIILTGKGYRPLERTASFEIIHSTDSVA